MSKKNKEIHLILTEEEYTELMKKKEAMGFKTYSSVIRMFIRYGICVSVDFDPFYENATQIARVGNNINQIAKAVNESKDITKYQVELLQKHMNKLEQIFNDFVDDKIKLVKYISEDRFRGDDIGSNEDNQSNS